MVAFYLAAKNVSRKKERSLLTIVGVMLAVGAFISLLSIAEGLYNQLQREMNGRTVDIYVLPRNSLALPVGPIAGVGLSTESIPDQIRLDLASLPNVESVANVWRFQQIHEGRGIVVWALDAKAFQIFQPGLGLLSGRWPTSDGEVVLGQALARTVAMSEGDRLKIDDRDFNVVGIFAAGGINNHFAYVAPEAAGRITHQGAQEVWIKLKEESGRDVAAQDINNDEKKRFVSVIARTREQYLGAANDFINYAWLLQFAVAAIGVLIAMTAAMNTMLMSTYERLKEFATLRAIGASRLTVLIMIITESVILSASGGVLGAILGTMGSLLLDNAVVTLLKLTFPMGMVTVSLIVESLVLSVVIGFVGAAIPCLLIYRVNIITGLRQE